MMIPKITPMRNVWVKMRKRESLTFWIVAIIVAILMGVFLEGCYKPNNKQSELDSCITQALSLFSNDKPVDRAWHVVGCMDSKGYKFKTNDPFCKADGNNRFLGKCYE